MTGSANDRFLMRSVRSLLPNSIDPQLDPKELIRRRILNHEGNVADCASIAGLAALAHFRRPDISLDGDKVTVSLTKELSNILCTK